MARYRVEELAQHCEVSVDTVRYYQARGLLGPPEREGRVAWYGDPHVARLGRIRELKERGCSLAMVARILDGALDADEQALAVALAGSLPGDGDGDGERPLSVDDLAARTEVGPPLLEALVREGLLVPRDDSATPYTAADVAAVEAGVALLASGVPLSELLALAREHDAAVRAVAERAVDLFARYVRDPVRDAAADDDEAAEAVVGALVSMLPATERVVTHHFRRRLLAAARARIEGREPAGQRDRAS